MKLLPTWKKRESKRKKKNRSRKIKVTPKTVAEITPEYAFEVFCELFRQESYTLSVIKPLDQKGKDI